MARGSGPSDALHEALGDDAFREGLHRFFREYAGTSATTDDFITVMSEASGRDLDDLLDGWLRSEALPPAVTIAFP